MTALFNEVVPLRVKVVQHGEPGNVTLSISTDSNEDNAIRAMEFIEKFCRDYRKVKSRRTPKDERIYEIVF